MTLEKIKIKKLNDNATIPTRSHSTDAGLDLYASESVWVDEGTLISTGIAVDIPSGFEGTVRPRSGLTSRTALRVQLGTVDSGYNGELKIIADRSEEHTSELQSRFDLVCRLLLEKKKATNTI